MSDLMIDIAKLRVKLELLWREILKLEASDLKESRAYIEAMAEYSRHTIQLRALEAQLPTPPPKRVPVFTKEGLTKAIELITIERNQNARLMHEALEKGDKKAAEGFLVLVNWNDANLFKFSSILADFDKVPM